MQQHQGVTLFELIVIVAVISILAVIAAPSLKRLTEQNRVAAQVNDLVGDLQFARQRAVQTARRVVVCPVDDNGNCTRANWRKGWTVFRNDNPESPPALDSQDRIIRVHKLHDDALEVSANQSLFAFRPLGSAKAGTIEICSSDGRVRHAVVITPAGRIRVIPKIPPNQDASCSD